MQGRHEIKHSISLTDYYVLRQRLRAVLKQDKHVGTPGEGPWRVQSDLSYLPTGETNLAAQAALLFRQATGLGPAGGLITLKKRIPVCGGYGGGSSDAAAVLRIMNRISASPLSWAELEELSLPLGADVPFCIRGGTALAEGKGEKLTPLPDLDGRALVLCRPDFSCSTPQLFKALDARKIRLRPDVAGMVRAIEEGDTAGAARRLFNVFEEVLPRKQGDTVREIKDHLLGAGALGAAMTGSGSGVFGVFADAARAGEACKTLREAGVACYASQTTPRLV